MRGYAVIGEGTWPLALSGPQARNAHPRHRRDMRRAGTHQICRIRPPIHPAVGTTRHRLARRALASAPIARCWATEWREDGAPPSLRHEARAVRRRASTITQGLRSFCRDASWGCAHLAIAIAGCDSVPIRLARKVPRTVLALKPRRCGLQHPSLHEHVNHVQRACRKQPGASHDEPRSRRWRC